MNDLFSEVDSFIEEEMGEEYFKKHMLREPNPREPWWEDHQTFGEQRIHFANSHGNTLFNKSHNKELDEATINKFKEDVDIYASREKMELLREQYIAESYLKDMANHKLNALVEISEKNSSPEAKEYIKSMDEIYKKLSPMVAEKSHDIKRGEGLVHNRDKNKFENEMNEKYDMYDPNKDPQAQPLGKAWFKNITGIDKKNEEKQEPFNLYMLPPEKKVVPSKEIQEKPINKFEDLKEELVKASTTITFSNSYTKDSDYDSIMDEVKESKERLSQGNGKDLIKFIEENNIQFATKPFSELEKMSEKRRQKYLVSDEQLRERIAGMESEYLKNLNQRLEKASERELA
jgi:hypothetical protein